MKPLDNDKWLDNMLAEALGMEKSRPDFETWRQSHTQAMQMLTSQANRSLSAERRLHNTGSIIMKSRMVKVTVAAAVVVALLVGVNRLSGPGSTAGLAFAQVIQNFQRKGYTFSYSVEHNGQSPMQGSGMVLEPGLKRLTMDTGTFRGMAIVTDSIRKKLFWVNRDALIIGDQQLPDTKGFDFSMKPVDKLWDLRDGSEQELGTKQVNESKLVGFRVHEQVEEKLEQTIVIWADAETGLPVEVEISCGTSDTDSQKMSIVLRDFKFDVQLDESLFGSPETKDSGADESGKLAVYPGKGIGQLHFGMPIEQARQILGEPDFVIGSRIFQYPGLAIAASEDGQVTNITCGDLNKHDSAHVKLCKHRTAEGIGIGSSEADITAAYAEASSRRAEGRRVEMRYLKIGAAFFLHDDGIYAMVFWRPR